MARGVSQTWSPTQQGADLAFVSSRMCGAKKRLLSPYSQNSILQLGTQRPQCQITWTLPALLSIRTQIFLGRSRIGSLSPLLQSSIFYKHRKLTQERHAHQKPIQLSEVPTIYPLFVILDMTCFIHLEFSIKSRIQISKTSHSNSKQHLPPFFLSAAKRPVVSPVVEQLAILLSVIQHVILDHSK